MIRIDEIYYNVFVSAMQHRPQVGLHWFYPFGSVGYSTMMNVPRVIFGQAELRLIFWDQEPLYQETAKDFFDKFCQFDISDTILPPRTGYDGPKIVITSEDQSKMRHWLEHTYKLKTDYYFFHGWAALDWYRGYNHSYLFHPWSEREFEYAFICPNNIIGGHRRHRVTLFAKLAERNLIEKNLVSFPDICPFENTSAVELALEQGLDLSNCELPRIIDHNYNHANDSHKINFWDPGTRAFAHIVTETVYDSHRLHLTEKTFKPIVMQQPFILVAPQHSLKYLRNYGFKTFSKIWDETYDDLPDNQRIIAIADLASEISSWTPKRLREAQKEITDVVQHNHDWFYGGFQDFLWTELQTMIKRW